MSSDEPWSSVCKSNSIQVVISLENEVLAKIFASLFSVAHQIILLYREREIHTTLWLDASLFKKKLQLLK